MCQGTERLRSTKATTINQRKVFFTAVCVELSFLWSCSRTFALWLAARHFRVEFRQSVELRDPLFQRQAPKRRHANRFVQPVVRFAAPKIEIAVALLNVNIVTQAL